MQVKEKYLELDMEKLEYNKAIYYHLAYLTSMQGISCQMPGWMTHKISRRNINNLRYAGDIILKAESKEELKSLLMKVNEDSEKASLKLKKH